jgi:acetate kinase
MNILVLNPGGNSLKVQLVECRADQRHADEGRVLLSVSIEGIGKEPELSVMQDKRKSASQPIEAENFKQAAANFLKWSEKCPRGGRLSPLSGIDAATVRVVHGGREFAKPILIDGHVLDKIVEFERLAPLHNKSCVEVLEPIRCRFPELPIYAVFDTAFHRTMPDYASIYPIPIRLAERHQIRRYGFHGISHRYLLERYAHIADRDPSECNIVSMHLESGCSVTAIERGRSVDNSMGLTPLEGLMMGTRSGDIDPSMVALLMHDEHMTIDEVIALLNKKSGLMGISEKSLDTRVLMKEYDSNPKAKLAMDMFAYRIRKAVGAYIAALGSVDAIVFGGGIGENGVFVRRSVCEGLRGFGLELDGEANQRLIDKEGMLSRPGSRLQAWVIPTEEGLQMAHECLRTISDATVSDMDEDPTAYPGQNPANSVQNWR